MAARKKPYSFKRITLPPIANSWLLYAKATGRPETTLSAYLTAMKQFIRYTHPESPLALTSNDISLWLVDMRNAGYADTTQQSRFQIIRGFYKWAVREGEITVNPTDALQRPGDVGDRIPQGLSDGLLASLLNIPGKDFMSRRDLAILSMLADTGMRHSEIAGLTLADVDVLQGLVSVAGKGRNRKRTTIMGSKTRLNLDRYIRSRASHQYAHRPALWLGLQGPLGYASFSEILSRHGKRIGLPGLYPHMLRHTWASKTRKAGMSDGDLLVLGGWRTRAMLDLYGKYEAQERALTAYEGNSVIDHLK